MEFRARVLGKDIVPGKGKVSGKVGVQGESSVKRYTVT
jgi:hypothetical protein